MYRFVLVLALFCVSSAVLAEASDVLVLGTDSFDDAIASNEFVLVEFYAPWCGHCKKLAPEYEVAATELKGVATLANVDATVDGDLAQRFGVRGYPTLKFFVSGKEHEYNGPRDSAGIVNWVKKQVDPVPTVASQAALDELLASNERVLAVGAVDHDSEDFAAVKSVALAQEEVVVVELASGLGLGAGQARLTTPHADVQTFSGSLSELGDWVDSNAFPLVEEVPENGQGVFKRLFGSGKAFALVFLDNDDSRASSIEELEKLATDLQDTFRFAWLDTGIWGRVLPQVGASGTVTPTAAVWPAPNDADPNRTPLAWDETVPFTIAGLRQFADEVLAGTAKGWTKSEAIPEDNDGPVKVLVWNNFEDEVLSSGKSVFVEFYAPWCGHCKSLAPVWEQLGEAFTGQDDIVIAKMDATANHVPSEYGVTGFPTLKLFTPGSSTPTDYNGGRDLDALVEFVKTNAA